MLTVSWFSGGVSSAVATKIAINQIDKIIYQHIDDQHEDTLRFVADCERWFGVPIEIMQSPYKSVEAACLAMSFINGIHGATCTRILKRRLRKEWEIQNCFFVNFRYVWGMDCTENKPRPPRKISRVEGIRDAMPQQEHLFPLVDHNITKEEAHGILAKAGIRRPAMYDLGFPNNNCKVCVKGGKGYMNLCRKVFPVEFKARALLERKVGALLERKVGAQCLNGIWLDELDPDAGRDYEIIVPECGANCEIIEPSVFVAAPDAACTPLNPERQEG
jgi:hypothetical protein